MRRLLITATVLIAVLLTAGFLRPVRADTRPLHIAVSFADMSRTIFQTRAQMIKDEAAKMGNVTVDVFDAQNKQDNQNKDLELIVEQKYDGLLISPVNVEGSIASIQGVIDADIPVVTLVRSAKGVQTLAHVGTDDLKGGQLQGQIITELFPKGAKMFNIQGTPGATNAIDRNKGLHSVLDKNPDFKFVFEQPANFLRPDAQKAMQKAFDDGLALPELINCQGEEMAFGVLDVLKDKGMLGKAVIVAWDSSPQTLKYVQDGTFAATIEPFPGKQAQTAFHIVVDYLLDGKQPMAHDVVVAPVLLTRGNLADAERYAELMAPATATAASTVAATPGATSAK